MRIRNQIGIALVAAASMVSPAAFAQVNPPAPPRPPAPARTRSAATVTSSSPYLGIGVRDIDTDRAKELKLKDVRGAEITRVYEESPAAKAGLKEGDVVLEYNGQSVEGGEQLSRLVHETPIGRQVKVIIARNGATQTMTPTVEAGKGLMLGGGTWVMPDVKIPEFNMPPMEIPRLQMAYQNPVLGIDGEALGQQEQLAEYFGVKDGVLVTNVRKNSAAEKAGIKAGDVIVKVDDSKVGSPREITSALRTSRAKKNITVTVVRNKKELPLPVTLDSPSGPATRAGLVWGPFEFEPVTIGPVHVAPIDFRPLLLEIPNIRIELLHRDGVI